MPENFILIFHFFLFDLFCDNWNTLYWRQTTFFKIIFFTINKVKSTSDENLLFKSASVFITLQFPHQEVSRHYNDVFRVTALDWNTIPVFGLIQHLTFMADRHPFISFLPLSLSLLFSTVFHSLLACSHSFSLLSRSRSSVQSSSIVRSFAFHVFISIQ